MASHAKVGTGKHGELQKEAEHQEAQDEVVFPDEEPESLQNLRDSSRLISMQSKSTSNASLKRQSTIMKDLSGVSNLLKEIQGDRPAWINDTSASLLFALVIVLNTAFIGIEVELRNNWNGSRWDELDWSLWLINSAFLFLFLLEISLRMCADGILNFFKTFWGIFDTIVTVFGVLDVWVLTPLADVGSPLSTLTALRVFRLLRLVRIVRLLRFSSELVLLVRTLAESLRAVFWMGVLMIGVLYLFAVMCCTLLLPAIDALGDSEHPDDVAVRRIFGSLGSSLFTHFVLVTTENWTDIADPVMAKFGWGWGLYFIVYMAATHFALLNMVIGVITEKMLKLEDDELPFEQLQHEVEEFKHVMEIMFTVADVDHSGALTRQELGGMFGDKRFLRILEAFEVNTSIPFEYLWPIIDWNGDDSISMDELVNACLRLRGSAGKHGYQILVLQSDLNKGACELKKDCRTLTADVERRCGGIEERLDCIERSAAALVAAMTEKVDSQRKGCKEVVVTPPSQKTEGPGPPSTGSASFNKSVLKESAVLHENDRARKWSSYL